MQQTIPASRETEMPATLLEHGTASAPPAIDQWCEGLRVGPFVLKKCLGRGGMGVVWLAEQIEPLQRLVAIKVMTWDDGGPMARAMFELERQALAQLSHRAIAQIHDAGRLPDGSLFFAMEYVPGVALHRFVREQRPGLRQLAALMIDLCLGVQHAHQRNLIHRDIKPGNILVQQVDGALLPRLIDFGIAMTSQAGSKASSGAGTPGYMSPEQQQPGPKGIDQRSDVYGLGAVLAECLCRLAGVDNPPGGFDSVHARAVLQQTLGRGRKRLPPEPDRRAALDQLGRQPEELRAIARKALAPDREQRYDSADAMAQDLRRWLESRPVQALPATRRYHLRCYLRRHALASSAAALIVIAIVSGLVLALDGWSEAREQSVVAEAAQRVAEQRRNDAERLIQFMLGDFANKLRPIGRLDLLDSIGSEALEYLTARTTDSHAPSALARARALRTLGEVQSTRQQFPLASMALSRAAGVLQPFANRQAPEQANIEFELGQISYYRGEVEYSQKNHAQAGVHWRAYLEHARKFAALTPDRAQGQQEIAYALTNLGVLAQAEERLEDALGLFQELISLRRSIPMADGDLRRLDLANSLSWATNLLSDLGRSAEAAVLGDEAIALVVALKVQHPENAQRRQREINYRFAHAEVLIDLERFQDARNELARAIPVAREDLANDPTQPLRLVKLAQIGALLARLEPPLSAGSRSALDAALAGSTLLSAADSPMAVQALICLATEHATGDARCLLPVLGILLGTMDRNAPDFTLVDRSIELLRALAKHDSAIAARHLNTVQDLFGRLPVRHRARLRHTRLAGMLVALSK